jgi:hypothetical protein
LIFPVQRQHNEEWKRSGVSPDLINLNVESVTPGYEAFELLLYSDRISRLNTGRLPAWALKKYTHIEDGGWWCSGLDPLQDWKPMLWGRFKPNTPRVDQAKGNGKLVKYEAPPKESARLVYFRVSINIWQRISDRYSVPLPAIIEEVEGEAKGFWQWVETHPEIPLLLTEGEKKAAACLSLGFVAIALPGIWMGVQRKGDIFELHPDLVPMAGQRRNFVILFDHETKIKPRNAVRRATLWLGKAIKEQGANCEVGVLPGPEKGVDDWLVSLGKNRAESALCSLLADAISLEDYRRSQFVNFKRGIRAYLPNLQVNVRYLSSAVQLPQSGLVGIISRMGTGKTELIAAWRKANPRVRFLNNGHRVTLLKNLAQRLQTQIYSELGSTDLSTVTALSITVDSLYKLSFSLKKYGCIFIDEASQFLAHLLLSKTCKDNQTEILELLEYIVYNAPLVVIADANLDDATINFFRAMRPEGEQPFIIKNDYKDSGRQVFWYEEKDNSALVAQACSAAMAGQKFKLVSDSKKFIKKMERLLTGLEVPTPDGGTRSLRIKAIYSENSGSEENIEFIKNIRSAVKNCDVLLASPSLGTGVDIPDYHFNLIFGVFHAVSLAATDCSQMLWRYRPNVDMHIWVNKHPLFGYKPINPAKIKQQILDSNRMTAFLIRRDKKTGERGAEKDWALEAYCQIIAQKNFSINNLRWDLKSLLEEMGNQMIVVDSQQDKTTAKIFKDIGQELDDEYCQGVVNAADINKQQYRLRMSKDYLDPEKLEECEKFRIRYSYGLDISPELIKLDDHGRLITKLISLEELLAELADPQEILEDEQTRKRYACPPSLVIDRDSSERDHLPLCFHWKNRSSAWLARFNLGLRDIVLKLFAGEEFTRDSPQLVIFQDLATRCAVQIKAVLGFWVSPDKSKSAIWTLALFLEQFGLKLQSHKRGARGEQVRHYSLDPKSKEFAMHVLAYREQQRREREEQQRQRDERNASFSAQMQKRYGIQPVSTPPPKENQEKIKGGVDTSYAFQSCQDFIGKLEIGSASFVGESDLVEAYLEAERQGKLCELPSHYWQRVTELIGVVSLEIVEAYRRRIELLQAAVEYGSETVKAVFCRWSIEQRWQTLFWLEDHAASFLEHLSKAVPQIWQWASA